MKFSLFTVAATLASASAFTAVSFRTLQTISIFSRKTVDSHFSHYTFVRFR